ncbi:MAG: HAD family phosphatase [Planctomycetaceae bacterium]|nr:HAD family phosphatase [Planctomycetaceae bacterium]
MNYISGIICDLDGTLVESEELHLIAWNELVIRAGHQPPSPNWNDDCIGLPDTYAAAKTIGYFPEMGSADHVNAEKQVIYRELVAKKGRALAYPGLYDALARVRDAGIPLAVGTNSVLENTKAALEAAGLAEFFPVTVTLDQVERGKPAPDIYLEAARRLGVPPERCAVLEDSTAGLEAAHAAGCLVLGLTTTWPADKLVHADHIFSGTADALGWVLVQQEAARIPKMA